MGQVAAIFEEINPKFKYGKSLASTFFQMINNQIYYAEHLPKLTSLSKRKTVNELEKMLNHFAKAVINY